MKHFLLIFIFILLAIFSSCKKIMPDDKFTIQKKSYYGDELKIDGYYFSKYYEGLNIVYFFYTNGIQIYGSTFNDDRLAEHEMMYENGEYYQFIKDDESSWGIFLIDGNTISFEAGIYEAGIFKIYKYNGEILNDTTFKINERYRIKRNKQKDYEVFNATFHFKQFSPKPDSTNSFID